MKDKVSLNDMLEIAYITSLIVADIHNIEKSLNAKQKLLQKFKDKNEK